MLGALGRNPEIYGRQLQLKLSADPETRTAETIGAMRALAQHASVRDIAHQVAVQLASNCGQMQRLCQLKELYRFFEDRLLFKRDTWGFEHLRHPDQLLSEMVAGRTAADCDDLSTAAAAVAIALGFEPAYVTDALGPRDPWAHVYPAVRFRGAWLPMDPQHRTPFAQWPPAGRRKVWTFEPIKPMASETRMFRQVATWLQENSHAESNDRRGSARRGSSPAGTWPGGAGGPAAGGLAGGTRCNAHGDSRGCRCEHGPPGRPAAYGPGTFLP